MEEAKLGKAAREKIKYKGLGRAETHQGQSGQNWFGDGSRGYKDRGDEEKEDKATFGLRRVAGEGLLVGMERQLLVERDQVWRLLVISITQPVVSSPLW